MYTKLKIKLISNNRELYLDDENYSIVQVEGIDFPILELNMSSNAGYDGSILNSKRIDKRYISIQADYKGKNREFEREKLISFFNPKTQGTLLVEYYGGVKAINYEIESFSSKITNINDKLNFNVDLVCGNPYFSDVKEKKCSIARWRGGFMFPLVIPQNKPIIVGLREPSLIVNVNNTGSVESGLIVEFKALGTLSKPSLININTNEHMKINKSMESGEVIRINTNYGSKKVIQFLKGMENDIMNYWDLTGTFLQLKVGDNLFRYEAESNIDNLEVNLYYRPLYLGV